MHTRSSFACVKKYEIQKSNNAIFNGMEKVVLPKIVIAPEWKSVYASTSMGLASLYLSRFFC